MEPKYRKALPRKNAYKWEGDIWSLQEKVKITSLLLHIKNKIKVYDRFNIIEQYIYWCKVIVILK